MWVPPKVTREVQQERERQRGELAAQLVVLEETRRWNKELRQIEDTLQLVWAPGNVTAPGLTPNRFHILRHNAGAPPSLIPLEDEDGGFRAPGAWMFDKLQREDLWSSRANAERKRRLKELTEAKERAKARERRDRADEINQRLWSKENTSVLIRKGL